MRRQLAVELALDPIHPDSIGHKVVPGEPIPFFADAHSQAELFDRREVDRILVGIAPRSPVGCDWVRAQGDTSGVENAGKLIGLESVHDSHRRVVVLPERQNPRKGDNRRKQGDGKRDRPENGRF